jgi:hypothetical protein
MATTSSKSITFIVSGEEQTTAAGTTRGAGPSPLPLELSQGRVKQSVRLGAQ